MIKAALFDLDGVVFDTESQYTNFWSGEGKKFHPEILDFAQCIKGQTLVQIYEKYFSEAEVFTRLGLSDNVEAEQAKITQRLNDFEQNMKYVYIPGFENFISELRMHDVKCAVVTSSNIDKMQNVYRAHPEFNDYFDRVLTSENFEKSKPDPDCYLKGAAIFNTQPSECIGFEDSFNGIQAVRDAGVFVIGLATTNPYEAIFPLCDHVIIDYKGLAFGHLDKIVSSFQEK